MRVDARQRNMPPESTQTGYRSVLLAGDAIPGRWAV